MYVKEYRHGDVNTRAMATFAAIHEAVLTSPGAIPNVEQVVSLYLEHILTASIRFTFQIQDAGDSYDEPIPTFVLDRTADQPELWLMPGGVVLFRHIYSNKPDRLRFLVMA